MTWPLSTWAGGLSMPSRDIICEDLLITPPLIEPLDLEEVKKQRRFSSSSLDTRFDQWMSAARQQFEEETGLQLITATRVFLMDCFPVQDVITFWRAPVQSIVSITYGEPASPESEMDPADYEVFPTIVTAGPYPTPGGVRLVSGASWPSVSDDRPGAVRITYVAGFGDAPGAVPELIHYALMQYVGDFHQFAENQSEKPVSLLPIGAGMVRRQAAGMMTPVRRLTRF